MKYFAALILIGFLGTVFLGFMPMDHNTHHMPSMESPCPIAAMFNVVCSSDTASMAVIHIGALQSFLNAPISTTFSLTITLLAVGLLFITLFKWPDIQLPALLGHKRWRFSRAYPSPLEKERSWLSLFENSPSFA
jgi:hypothetical protein